jgi:hypothetical protein
MVATTASGDLQAAQALQLPAVWQDMLQDAGGEPAFPHDVSLDVQCCQLA